MLIALTVLGVWVGVSMLFVISWALGVKFGYLRGHIQGLEIRHGRQPQPMGDLRPRRGTPRLPTLHHGAGQPVRGRDE